jgi:hypothetical protein
VFPLRNEPPVLLVRASEFVGATLSSLTWVVLVVSVLPALSTDQ